MTNSPLGQPLTGPLGPPSARKLAKHLDLHTLGDLLRHYPRRYLRPAELTRLAALPVGELVTVVAEVVQATTRSMRHRKGRMLQAVVTDGSDTLELTFFSAYGHEGRLVPGFRGLFTGTVTVYGGRRQLAHPSYVPLPGDLDAGGARSIADAPIPIYPATAKVNTWAIQRSVRTVLDPLVELPDPVPADVRAARHLVSVVQALRLVHRPMTDEDWRVGQHRLRFEEAFVLQAALARRRAAQQELPATPRRRSPLGLLAAFDERLPFALTPGQRAVSAEIEADLGRDHPMQRLLQGEVGSGKTVVALRAMLTVVDGGGQAALLAPTEVLAMQHHRSITAMLGGLADAGMLGGDERGTRVALLTGSLPTAARRRALLNIAGGDAGIVIGTHALIEGAVEFLDLGLVVVDEQHRFGVEQRDALRGKGIVTPHLLVMTATPIPRTVAMTVFGDLDVSTLAELPAGRSPIASHVVPVGEKPAWLARTWQRLAEEVAAGHQVYVVCPRIGDGEQDEDVQGQGSSARAVLDVIADLRARPELSGLCIEMLHGRMAAEDRDAVMRAFASGAVDVLVATTVIEVGVDVANATVMVVLDADRFGVSQLHQLRGRVGRGTAPGLCLLVTEVGPDSPARQRLDAVARTGDGFELARLDLEQRREGDVLGAAQSGRRSSLRLLRVLTDERLIEQARHDATAVVAEDPGLGGHPVLEAAIADLLDPEREAYLERT